MTEETSVLLNDHYVNKMKIGRQQPRQGNKRIFQIPYEHFIIKIILFLFSVCWTAVYAERIENGIWPRTESIYVEGEISSMVLDSRNKVHVVTCERNETGAGSDIFYYTNEQWNTRKLSGFSGEPVNLSKSKNLSVYPSIGIGRDGTIYVVWIEHHPLYRKKTKTEQVEQWVYQAFEEEPGGEWESEWPDYAASIYGVVNQGKGWSEPQKLYHGSKNFTRTWEYFWCKTENGFGSWKQKSKSTKGHLTGYEQPKVLVSPTGKRILSFIKYENELDDQETMSYDKECRLGGENYNGSSRINISLIIEDQEITANLTTDVRHWTINHQQGVGTCETTLNDDGRSQTWKWRKGASSGWVLVQDPGDERIQKPECEVEWFIQMGMLSSYVIVFPRIYSPISMPGVPRDAFKLDRQAQWHLLYSQAAVDSQPNSLTNRYVLPMYVNQDMPGPMDLTTNEKERIKYTSIGLVFDMDVDDAGNVHTFWKSIDGGKYRQKKGAQWLPVESLPEMIFEILTGWIVCSWPDNVMIKGNEIYRRVIQDDKPVWLHNEVSLGAVEAVTSPNDIFFGYSQSAVDIETAFDLGYQGPALMSHAAPNCWANLANGNLFVELPLFSSNGAGINTNLILYYNSLNPHNDTMGRGWHHSYHVYLTASPMIEGGEPPFELFLHGADGRLIKFMLMENTAYHVYFAWPEFGCNSVIYPWTSAFEIGENLAEGEFVMVDKYGDKSFFRSDGKLKELKDLNGNILTCEYTDGLLSCLIDTMQRRTRLSYDAHNRLNSVIAPNGAIYTFSYHPNSGHLYNVFFPKADGSGELPTWEFRYHTDTDPSRGARIHLISEIFTPEGKIKGFSTGLRYYPDNRFRESEDAHGGLYTVIYEDSNHKLPLWDGSELKSCRTQLIHRGVGKKNTRQSYLFDCDPLRSMVLQITDPENHVIQWKLGDPAFTGRNIFSFKDELGHQTQYTYYNTSQLIWFCESPVRNNIKTITRPGCKAPIRCTYTNRDRIESLTDAEGSQTTFKYDSKGNILRVQFPDPEAGQAQPGDCMVFQYDSMGRLVSTVNPGNNTDTFEYKDASTGLVTHIHRAGSNKPYQFEYDVMGNQIALILPEGGRTDYILDNLSQVRCIELPQVEGKRASWDYQYNLDGALAQVDGPLKAHIRYIYDDIGRVSEINVSGRGTLKYFYDNEGNVIETHDFNGNKTFYDYNKIGLLCESRLSSEKTNYLYYPNGNLMQVQFQGPQGPYSLHYEYDGRRNVKKKWFKGPGTDDRSATEECCQYDDNDRLKNMIVRQAGSGVFLSGMGYGIDKRGRMVSVTNLTKTPDNNKYEGPTSHFGYDKNNNCTWLKDPKGNIRRFEYDKADRICKTVDACGEDSGLVVRYSYDDNGRCIEMKQSNPAGEGMVGTTYRYNARSELVGITRYGEDELHCQRISYDELGNPVFYTDPENRKVKYEYDETGNTRFKYLYPDDKTTWTWEYQYDGNGNLIKSIDPGGNSYVYGYDAFNRVTSIRYPGDKHYPSAVEKRVFDDYGRLKQHIDCKGQLNEFIYDGQSRLIKEIHWESTGKQVKSDEIVREYDLIGNVKSLTSTASNMKIAYDYNELQQVAQSSWSLNGVLWKAVGFTYDGNGSRKTMTGPEGEIYRYQYDPGNRLVKLRREAGPNEPPNSANVLEIDIKYNKSGLRDQMILPNGVKICYLYDPKGRLTDLKYTGNSDKLIAGFHYEYNHNDEIVRKRLLHTDLDFSYNYNRLGWLTDEICSGCQSPPFTVPAYHYRWTYDAVGNRKAAQCISGASLFGTAKYEYGAACQLLSKETPQGMIRYRYDANGNQIERSWENQKETFIYRWDNRLSSYTDVHGQNWRYYFSPEGQCFAVLPPKQAPHYMMYDGVDVISDYTFTNNRYNMTSTYLNGSGVDSKIARLTSTGNPGKWEWYYYIGDHLKTLHQMVDPAQKPVNTYLSNSWGEPIPPGLTNPIDERYIGLAQREKSEIKGLYNFRNRIYDSQAGRFLQRDPLAEGESPNLYTFNRFSPLNYVDPMGLQSALVITDPSEPDWIEVSNALVRNLQAAGYHVTHLSTKEEVTQVNIQSEIIRLLWKEKRTAVIIFNVHGSRNNIGNVVKLDHSLFDNPFQRLMEALKLSPTLNYYVALCSCGSGHHADWDKFPGARMIVTSCNRGKSHYMKLSTVTAYARQHELSLMRALVHYTRPVRYYFDPLEVFRKPGGEFNWELIFNFAAMRAESWEYYFRYEHFWKLKEEEAIRENYSSKKKIWEDIETAYNNRKSEANNNYRDFEDNNRPVIFPPNLDFRRIRPGRRSLLVLPEQFQIGWLRNYTRATIDYMNRNR